MEDMINIYDKYSYELKQHKDENGNICTCCQTADTILTHSIISSAVKSKKIEDVLQNLTEWFTWGYYHKEYICECLDKCKSLDCISTNAIAIHLLNKANEYIDQPLEICVVEIIHQCSTSECTEWKKQIENIIDNPNSIAWIGNNICYHQCLGLVDKQKKITLFDASMKGKIYSCQNVHINDKEYSILAIKVTSKKSVINEEDYCKWDGMLQLKYNSWYKLPIKPTNNGQNISETSDVITIYISGVAITLSNPEAGVGVARSIRQSIPNANIISVDYKGFLGALDPSFSSSCIIVSNSTQSQFEDVFKLLSVENSYYIPCRDKDIHIFSKAKSILLGNSNETKEDDKEHINMEFISQSNICLEEIANRILCPLPCSIEKLEKPTFFQVFNDHSDSMPFQIPEFYEITSSRSLLDIKHFTDSVGFPLILKGKRQGGIVCNNLSDILFTFAKYSWSRKNSFLQKYLAGCEKCIAYSAVDGELTGALIMTKIKYSAEGKVEMGDIMYLTNDSYLYEFVRVFCRNEKWTGGGEIEFIEDISGEKYLIDWNPRFPAWIFASSYTNLNLPAEFIFHYLNKASYKPPIQDNDTIFEFARTCIELPRSNQVTSREIHFNKMYYAGTKLKTNNDNQSHDNNFIHIMIGDNKSSSTATLHYEAELNKLCEYLNDIHKEGELITPKRLLCLPLINDSLQRNKSLITTTATNISKSFEISMFLSVKTQPHLDVLLSAKDNGYLCECISMSEALQALKAGFSSKQISLTGPAKFWSNEKIKSDIKTHFHSIFADHTKDLLDIFDRIDRNELDTDIIGIRWCPAISSSIIFSRFGCDCNNPEVIKTIISILKERLSKSKKIGMHFHHASSNLGLQNWLSQAKSFVRFCYDFGNILGQQVECIDFGGGFSSWSLFDEPLKLSQLFQMVSITFGESLPKIQFQLGKSITETAGVVITRIIQIRDTNDWIINDEQKNRAIIVDTSIADISSPHFHPVYWMNNKKMKWQLLKSGFDFIWGRTCMEFDRILTGIELPSDALPGDLLMITCCGAYDFSMSYNFGDGESRNISIIH